MREQERSLIGPVVLTLLMSAGCGPTGPRAPGEDDAATALALQIDSPVSLALDDRHAYWTTWERAVVGVSEGQLWRVEIGGGTPVLLVDELPTRTSLAVHDGRLFWFQRATGGSTLMTAATDGSGVETFASFSDEPVSDTRLLVHNGLLYWGGTAGVHALSTAGGEVATLFAHEASPVDPGPVVIAVDDTAVYWVEARPAQYTSVLKRALLDGSNRTRLANLGLTLSENVTVDGTFAYWFAGSLTSLQSRLYSVPVLGGPPDIDESEPESDAGAFGEDDGGSSDDAGVREVDGGASSDHDAGSNDVDGGVFGEDDGGTGEDDAGSSDVDGGEEDDDAGPGANELNGLPPTEVFETGGAPTQLIADARGLFFGDGSSTGRGIYRVQDGEPIALVQSGLFGADGNPHLLRLDDEHVYWFEGGERASLHRVAREPPEE